METLVGVATKLGGLFAELWRALHMYRRRGKVIALALAMSVVGHIGFVLSFYFSALVLTSPEGVPSMVEHFLLVPVGMTITSAVPTPGGVGGAEIAFGKLYDMVRYPTANGVRSANFPNPPRRIVLPDPVRS